MKTITKLMAATAFAAGLGLVGASDANATATPVLPGVVVTPPPAGGPSVPVSTVPYTFDFSLPQFNPSTYGGGILTGYEIFLNGTLAGTFSATNNSPTANVTVVNDTFLTGKIQLSGSTPSSVLPTTLALNFSESLASAGYSNQVLAPGATFTTTPPISQTTGANTGILASIPAVIGSSTFDVNGTTAGNFFADITGGGTSNTNIATLVQAGTDVEVQYFYNPPTPPCTETGTCVPEPASLSLLGAGLVGLGVATRRRRSKKA